MSSIAYDPNKPLNRETDKRTFESYQYLPRLSIEQLILVPPGSKLLIVNNFHGSTSVTKIATLRWVSKIPDGTDSYIFRMDGNTEDLYSDIYNERWFALRII